MFVRLCLDIVGMLLLVLARVHLMYLHDTGGAVDEKVKVLHFCFTHAAQLTREQSLARLVCAKLEQIIIRDFRQLLEVLHFHLKYLMVTLCLKQVSVDLVECFEDGLKFV